jgi:hypothetical protein
MISQSVTMLLVAGGDCDHKLGRSTATVNIMGCDWKKDDLVQESYKQEFGNLPAAILEVQITEIIDTMTDTRLNAIYAAFQDPPVIRSIDLRDTSAKNGAIEDSNEDQFVGDSGTGTKDAKNTPDVDSKGAQEDEVTVRFQYDGILNMDVKYTPVNGAVLPDLKDCYGSELDDDVDSFHVMDYLTFFYVRVDLEYVLIERSDPSMSLTCDIIENNITVSVASDLGIDSDTSFAAFWNGQDTATQNALAFCSDDSNYGSGACVFDVRMNSEGDDAGVTVDENSNQENRADGTIVTSLATGRPNPL